MVVVILGFLLSLIPTAALFYWLRNCLHRDDAAYRTLCDKSLRQGVLCSFVVLAVSGALQLLLRLIGLHKTNPLLYQALYNIIALALAEEAVKFLTFRRVLKKTDYPYSWMDVTLMMTLVGLGFGAIENLALIAVSLALLDLVLAVMLIVFFAKARKDARYTEPLHGTGAESAWPDEAWKPSLSTDCKEENH